jgi:hypothetical protein
MSVNPPDQKRRASSPFERKPLDYAARRTRPSEPGREKWKKLWSAAELAGVPHHPDGLPLERRVAEHRHPHSATTTLTGGPTTRPAYSRPPASPVSAPSRQNHVLREHNRTVIRLPVPAHRGQCCKQVSGQARKCRKPSSEKRRDTVLPVTDAPFPWLLGPFPPGNAPPHLSPRVTVSAPPPTLTRLFFRVPSRSR